MHVHSLQPEGYIYICGMKAHRRKEAKFGNQLFGNLKNSE